MADDVVWIGTNDGRLGKLVDGTLILHKGTVTTDWVSSKWKDWKEQIAPDFRRTLIFPSDGIEKGIPYNIVVPDDEDNMWVGSEGEGLFRVQSQSIKSLSSSQGLASDNVYPVMKSSTGDMWVGSWPAGLSRVHDGQVTAFTKADGVPGLVTALAEDRSGNIWVGSHSGLRIFSGGRLVVPPGMPEGTLPVIQVIHQMQDGAMMLGTPKGIYILAGTNSRWLTRHDGLASDDVRVILRRPQGRHVDRGIWRPHAHPQRSVYALDRGRGFAQQQRSLHHGRSRGRDLGGNLRRRNRLVSQWQMGGLQSEPQAFTITARFRSWKMVRNASGSAPTVASIA